jgi:hypothetical protein
MGDRHRAETAPGRTGSSVGGKRSPAIWRGSPRFGGDRPPLAGTTRCDRPHMAATDKFGGGDRPPFQGDRDRKGRRVRVVFKAEGAIDSGVMRTARIGSPATARRWQRSSALRRPPHSFRGGTAVDRTAHRRGEQAAVRRRSSSIWWR